LNNNGTKRSKPKVLVIGVLPPPAIGPSLAMKRLLEAENIRSAFDIDLLDISDTRNSGHIGRFDFTNAWLGIKHILQCIKKVVSRRPALVYLNLSEGLWGYIRDVGLVLPPMLLGCKVVFHLRGSQFRSFYDGMPALCRWFTRLLFRRVSRVIVLGHSLRPLFGGLVPDDRIMVVPNGIDYSQFKDVGRSGANGNLDKVLYFSNLRREKGTLRMIEALPEIVKSRPSIHVTFAGEWQRDEDQEYAESFILKHNLTGHVTFTGRVIGPDKIRLYKEHDVFVFTPVDPEGLPWVILEAMSAGLPVLTTDRGAIAEVVEEGRTGYIIEPQPKTIAEKLAYMIEHPYEARAMGMSGRERVEQFFSEPAYLKGVEQVLQEALNN
jgi:glycosyltransferase involved in cell wall biosynthesis